MQLPTEAAKDTAAPEQAPANKPLTRRMADFYVKQIFGKKARIKYWPTGLLPYSVVVRQPGTSVLAVLGEGETFEDALRAAVKPLEELRKKHEEVTK